MTIPTLSIVVPCYNEIEVLPETITQLSAVIDKLLLKKKIDQESHILFVDDGSTDGTWQTILESSKSMPRVRGLKLSRNRGHQNALLAGLIEAEADATISIDADLQDDLTVIEDMVDHFLNGIEIVYGVRKSRSTDTYLKRWTAEGYYKLVQRLGVDIVFNHADFRLMGKRAIHALQQYGEANLFLRGIVPDLGFNSATVEYDRKERFAGESKYPLSKMLSLALNGVTSFSATPLRLIALLGITIFLGSTLMSIWVLWVKLSTDQAIPGWASSVLPMYFLGGVQLLSLGVIGEYVAKIYLETKNRPRFVIEETTNGQIE